MSVRQLAAKGAILLTLGEGIGYAASFVRNMILARMLSKADFAMAAVFGMVMSLLEFTAKLGIARFLVRDKEGNDPTFVATAHGLQLASALVSALMITAGAPILARLFGLPGHVWAICLLAVVALLRGLEHLDVRRYERELRFGPVTLVEAIPQVLMTLAAWPVAYWLGDYRAVLILLFGKSLLSCVLSHLLAERSYRWSWQPKYAVRMLRFGWPLLLTGFLLFGIMQGDQFLVATFYSMMDLAPYAAAVGLVMAPQFVCGRVFNSVTLPLMAKVQDDPVQFRRRYQQVLSVMTLYATVSGVGFLLGADGLMRLVYGPKYAGTGYLLAWLAASGAFRALRMAPAVAAIAKGDSQNQLLSNLARAGSLLPAFVLAQHGQPLWMVAGCGLVGEALGGVVSLWRFRVRDKIPVGLTLRPMLGTAALLLSTAMLRTLLSGWPVWMVMALAVAAAIVVAVSVVLAIPELRVEAWTAVLWWENIRDGGSAVSMKSLASNLLCGRSKDC